VKLLLLISLVTLQANASDEKVCNYLKTNTFQKHAESVDNSNDKKFNEMLSKISLELDQKRETDCKSGKLWAIRDYDSCSSLCVRLGTSETRTSAALMTRGLIDLSKETRKCQTICKSYQMVAFAYEDGAKANSVSPDCRGTVDSSGRANMKGRILDGALDIERSFYPAGVAK
jgi:hypothetical protein